MATATHELDALRRAAAKAKARVTAARKAAKDEFGVSCDALRPLKEFKDDVRFKRRAYDLDKARKLTEKLLTDVLKRGLVVEVADGGSGLALIRDPAVQIELEDAECALRDANHELAKFHTERGDDLKKEREEAESAALKNAVGRGDVASIREILSGSGSPSRSHGHGIDRVHAKV